MSDSWYSEKFTKWNCAVDVVNAVETRDIL